jgi:hypothetical protein
MSGIRGISATVSQTCAPGGGTLAAGGGWTNTPPGWGVGREGSLGGRRRGIGIGRSRARQSEVDG